MRKILPAVLLAVVVCAPGVLQGQVNIGAQVSWGDNADLGFGGRLTARSPWVDPAIELIGAFDLFFPSASAGEDLSYWEANLNLVYNIAVSSEVLLPYAGVGLNIAHASTTVAGAGTSATEVGANLVGGLKLVAGSVTPFGEIRYELGGGEQFVLTGGLLFTVGAGSN
jgi:hypothetical protein